MSQARYSKDHEYIIVDGDVGTVGISEHAQAQLGDVVFVELPAVGDKVASRRAGRRRRKRQGGERSVLAGLGGSRRRQWRSRGRAEPHQRGRDGQGLDLQDQALRSRRTRRADGRSRLSGLPQDPSREPFDALFASRRHRSRARCWRASALPISTNSSPIFRPTSGSTACSTSRTRKSEIEVERALSSLAGAQCRGGLGSVLPRRRRLSPSCAGQRRPSHPAFRISDELYALSARDRAGHVAGPVRIPDPGRRADRHGGRQRLDV